MEDLALLIAPGMAQHLLSGESDQVEWCNVCGEVRYTRGISKALCNSWDAYRKPELSENHLGSLR